MRKDPPVKQMTALLIGGIGAILLGLPYIFHAFGPTEAEVVTWGKVSLYTGIILVILSIGIGRSNKKIFRGILALGYTMLAFLQLPPIFLWFAFNGMGISDGTPPSPFVAHWGYAIPHLALLIDCLLVPYYLTRGETRFAN